MCFRFLCLAFGFGGGAGLGEGGRDVGSRVAEGGAGVADRDVHEADAVP